MTQKTFNAFVAKGSALEKARIHFNRTKELFLCGIASMDELIAAKDALVKQEMAA
jgi:hypothetical protein